MSVVCVLYEYRVRVTAKSKVGLRPYSREADLDWGARVRSNRVLVGGRWYLKHRYSAIIQQRSFC